VRKSRRAADQRGPIAQLPSPCDVSDDAQVKALVERTVAEFGRLDAGPSTTPGVMARVASNCRQHARRLGTA